VSLVSFQRRHGRRAPLDRRRAERELFFWTARQWVTLTASIVVLISVSAYVIVALIHGQVPALGGWLSRLVR